MMTTTNFETSPPSANERLVFECHHCQWDDVLPDLGDNRDTTYFGEAIIPNILDETNVDSVYPRIVSPPPQSHRDISDKKMTFPVPLSSNDSPPPPKSFGPLPNRS